jgi:hypothetical protein
MDRDLLLLAGLICVPLAVVALVSAWADRRRPWAGLLVLCLGLGVALWAHLTHPTGGYTLDGLPDVMLETIAGLLR